MQVFIIKNEKDKNAGQLVVISLPGCFLVVALAYRQQLHIYSRCNDLEWEGVRTIRMVCLKQGAFNKIGEHSYEYLNFTETFGTQDRIAQWISASDFGSEGRGFDSHCGRLCFSFSTLFFVYICTHHFIRVPTKVIRSVLQLQLRTALHCTGYHFLCLF